MDLQMHGIKHRAKLFMDVAWRGDCKWLKYKKKYLHKQQKQQQ